MVAIVGNPNVGKTTLFNLLAGARQKISNFPGTTQEAHVATLRHAGAPLTLVDLPGVYGLGLAVGESRVCRGVLEGSLAPEGHDAAPADVVLLVLDATNLRRNLVLAGEVLGLRRPVVAVLSMLDDARRRGIEIDRAGLRDRLGVDVLDGPSRRGVGSERLLQALMSAEIAPPHPALGDAADIESWADRVHAGVASARAGEAAAHAQRTDRLDSVFTHPLLGVGLFVAVMTGLFWLIFRVAAWPMDWIDALFAWAAAGAASVLPAGAVRDLLVDGVLGGVGATVIFLPQIVLLFFLIALLEQTGYLARAALLVDRLLRPFGLPGHAFVPLLSGHACALPGLMATRGIPDRRERLATILVLPFMSCTARIPVYVLLTVLLFPGRPGMQALAFTGCYALGVAAGLLSALVARRTILRGPSRGMAMELPPYRAPDVGTALRSAADRGLMFLRKAGTVILGISVVLWWLGTYPQAGPSPQGQAMRAASPSDTAALAEADRLDAVFAAERTALGRIGGVLEPLFAPLGADRRLTIGILASFAAREVFVTTMAVQIVGDADADVEDQGVLAQLASAQRADGTPLFDVPTSAAMLVYFVLAMQCLPTLAVTAREAGGWKWAALQLGWMCGLAYGLAALVAWGLRLAGAG